jgi:hypothetical protein
MTRLRCYLFGCRSDAYSCCGHCGAAKYDPDYRQTGPISTALYWIRRYARQLNPVRKCDECGKRFVSREFESCCSSKCYDVWSPF